MFWNENSNGLKTINPCCYLMCGQKNRLESIKSAAKLSILHVWFNSTEYSDIDVGNENILISNQTLPFCVKKTEQK